MHINHHRFAGRLLAASLGVLSIVGSGLLFGQTVASFVEPRTTTLLYPDGGGASAAVKADFNGDGKLDLAVSENPNVPGVGTVSSVSVLIGNGDGTFKPPLRLSIPQISGLDNGAGSLSAKDFDGDGRVDIVVAVPGANKVYFYKGHGDGTFGAPVASDSTAGFDGPQAADLNGDGKLDIVGTNYSASKVTVMLGKGDGTFNTGIQLNSSASPRTIILADVNGDGKADILVGCYDGQEVDVYLNNGNGTFPTSPTPFAANMQVFSMYLGDFDGDGKKDLAVAGFSGGSNSWVGFMKGGGDGTFASPIVADFQPVDYAPVSFYGEAVTPDLNGDGKPDVIFGHPDNSLTVGLGLGNGKFDIREIAASSGPGFAKDSRGNIVLADGGASVCALAGDFNGDGIQDIVVAQYATNARMGGVSLILGTGGGNFASPRSFLFAGGSGYGSYDTKTVALVDVNGDGKLDIVHDGVLQTSGTTLFDVLLSNGNGTFGLPIPSVGNLPGAGITQITGFKVVDVDKDGKPDLVIAAAPAGVQGNVGTSATFVAYGNGDGTFGTIKRIDPGDPSWTVYNVFVGDFNGDGKPDIASLIQRGGGGGWHIEVYLQNPFGTFTRSFGVSNSDLGNNTLGLAIAAFDFNGDGKLDLICQGSGPDLNQPQSIKIFKGNGDGTFQAPIDGPQPNANGGPGITTDYRAADFNHDGKLDLVVAGYNVAVYLGNGNATFQAPMVYSPGVGGNVHSIDLVDFNGGGNIDIAIGNDSAFALLLGNSDGSFSRTDVFAEGILPIRAVRAGDLNGDGKPDVVVFHERDAGEFSMASVLINNSEPELLNISTRLRVLTGNDVLIAGFIVAGSDNKQLLLRALGPTLSQFEVPGVLADPTLELHDGTGAIIASNDNWKDTQQAAIAATGKAPPNDFESAILYTFAPGNYTAIVRGKNKTTGVALGEVYDLDQAVNSKLINISTRGFVDTGNNAMIGGFIIGGPAGGSSKIVVRALGPTLAQFGVPNVLADPTLELRDINGTLIASNDNWKDTQQAEIQASGYAPPNALESAIIVTPPPPGNTTAIVRGRNNTTGNALVEAYILPP